MKKANILAVALFAAAAMAGALFIGGSYGVGAQTVAVACSPSSTTVVPGQSVTLSATGGDGTNYSWSSPGLSITNPTGKNFNVTFNEDGTFPVTVMSGGTSSTCSVIVAGTAIPSGGTTGGTSTVPGLPNTGAMPE